MSLFGELDATEISTNPYHIDGGEYPGKITYYGNEDQDGQNKLVLQFTVTDELSEFFGRSTRVKFDIFPDLTSDDLKHMSPQDRADVLKAVGTLKRWLCGRDEDPNDRGLGILPHQLNDPEFDMKSALMDLEVDMCVVNNTNDKGTFTNLRWARIAE